MRMVRLIVVDAQEHAVVATAGTAIRGELTMQRLAQLLRILGQWAGDELGDRCGDLGW